MNASDIAAAYERHVDTVYRVCFAYLGNAADTEDAVQEVFIRYLKSAPAFTSGEHEKAWLIRVAGNLCKDMLRSAARRNVPLDEAPEPQSPEPLVDETLAVVLKLDEKYKDVVYLYYYEGYTTDEIAAMLARPPSTIRSHLSEARAILRRELGGEWT